MIATFFATQFNNIMKWCGIIGLALGVLLSVRKSGRDAERVVSAHAETERTEAELNEIKRHQEIINNNALLNRSTIADSLRKGEF